MKQKLLKGTWSPLPIEAQSVVATENALLFGGEEALLVRAKLTSENRFQFDHIPFDPSRYAPQWPTDPGHEIDQEDLSFGETFHIDRSRTPNQVMIHFVEYQGGTHGVSLIDDVFDFSKEVYIPNPIGDSDIQFAAAAVIRGDEFIAYSCYSLFHFRRTGDTWSHSKIPIPFDCDVECLALTFDASKLILNLHSVARTGAKPRPCTLIYERKNGRFLDAYEIEGALNDKYLNNIYLHEHCSIALTSDEQLWIHNNPCFSGNVQHKIQLESFAQIRDSTDAYTLVTSLERIKNPPGVMGAAYRTVKQYVRLIDNKSGQIVVNFELPELVEVYKLFSAVFLNEKVIIMAQNQIGIFEIGQEIKRAKPRIPGEVKVKKAGFDLALEVFAACARFENEDRARQITSQLSRIETDSHKVCTWIWRGLNEGHFTPAYAFVPMLESRPELYNVQDLIKFLAILDQNDPNAWARTYRFIQSKFSENKAALLKFWKQSEGVLRAELGFFLAQHGLLSKSKLPAASLGRATYELGHVSLSTHPDATYPHYLRRIRKVWNDAEIAAGLIDYASNAPDLGNEGGQWFEFVWPHATPEQRAMLVHRIDRLRGVYFFVEFFGNRSLDDRTRRVLEDQLAHLLAQEPTAPPNNTKIRDQVYLYSDAPFFAYTFLVSAIVLILDAKNRNAGLSAIGGATFARAILMSELFDTCKIPPDLKRTLSTLFQ